MATETTPETEPAPPNKNMITQATQETEETPPAPPNKAIYCKYISQDCGYCSSFDHLYISVEIISVCL